MSDGASCCREEMPIVMAMLWSMLFAGISVYWASGGMLGASTLGGSIERIAFIYLRICKFPYHSSVFIECLHNGYRSLCKLVENFIMGTLLDGGRCLVHVGWSKLVSKRTEERMITANEIRQMAISLPEVEQTQHWVNLLFGCGIKSSPSFNQMVSL